MQNISLISDGSNFSQYVIENLKDMSINFEILSNDIEELAKLDKKLISSKFIFLAIDNKHLNLIRETYYKNLSLAKVNFINIIHPSAQIDSSVKLGKNIFISYGVQIKAKSIIANNVIIKHGSTIQANVKIKENVFIEMDCYVNSDSSIGKNTYLSRNTEIKCLEIGDLCSIEKENMKIEKNVQSGTHFFKNIESPIFYFRN